MIDENRRYALNQEEYEGVISGRQISTRMKTQSLRNSKNANNAD